MQLVYLLVCLGFVAVGLANRAEAVGWFCTIFFGLCAVVFLIQLTPGASFLRLTPEGFLFCSLFRKSPFIPWREVSNFRVAAVPPSRKKMVVFDSNDTPSRIVRRVNRVLVGAGDALPDRYGMNPQELADLMNDWRFRAISSS